MCTERGGEGGQDYCELIKAKSLNFRSKKHPLPVTPSTDPATISQVEAQRERERERERGKVKAPGGGGESVNVLKINPYSLFFSSPSVISTSSRGSEEGELEMRSRSLRSSPLTP